MKQLLAAIFLTLLLAACGKDRKEIVVNPSLSVSELTLEAGERAEVTVSDAGSFTVSSSDERVASAVADVSRGKVVIEAKGAGSAIVSVYVGRPAPLTVKVTVTQTDRTPDISDQLGDRSMRYVSDDLALRYDDGGIIFETDSRGRYTIVDITAGRRIVFDAGELPSAFPQRLEKASLTVDGEPIALRYAAAEARSSDRAAVWYCLVTTDNRRIVIVTNEF
ncbi:MAG: hypothetical protein ACI4AX_05000 [Muribaculaceae bacterium]